MISKNSRYTSAIHLTWWHIKLCNEVFFRIIEYVIDFRQFIWMILSLFFPTSTLEDMFSMSAFVQSWILLRRCRLHCNFWKRVNFSCQEYSDSKKKSEIKKCQKSSYINQKIKLTWFKLHLHHIDCQVWEMVIEVAFYFADDPHSVIHAMKHWHHWHYFSICGKIVSLKKLNVFARHVFILWICQSWSV